MTGDENTEAVRAAIAARIESEGWSKAEAARLCGTTPSKLVQYLKGRTNPPISSVCRIAAGLGLVVVVVGREIKRKGRR